MWWCDGAGEMNRRAVLATSAAVVLLGGCGFALRQPPQLPFERLALVGFAPRSPLAAELRRRAGPNVRIVDHPAQAQVVLQALDDERQRSVVATTGAGQVRELELRSRLRFRASTPAGQLVLPTSELLLSRAMTYNESVALAKEHEEEELYRAMEADLITQVLSRLAALRMP